MVDPQDTGINGGELEDQDDFFRENLDLGSFGEQAREETMNYLSLA